MQIIIATHNQDKVREFKEILPSCPLEFISLAEIGITEVAEEKGKSYQENALIKARQAATLCPQHFVLADDSGLEVDLLAGFPGIYSARFAGQESSYACKIERLWQLLSPWDSKLWQAKFCCCLAFITPQGELFCYESQVQGRILNEKRGEHGFGYDPVFYLEELGLTTAQLQPAQKHALSHRGKALRQWYNEWRSRLEDGVNA